MRHGYFNRAGEPITLDQWVGLFGKTADDAASYRRVAEDYVTTPSGTPVWVSTVWLGIDHGWGDGPPLIFETMAFFADGERPTYADDLDMRRYATEADALAGHRAMVERVASKGLIDDAPPIEPKAKVDGPDA